MSRYLLAVCGNSRLVPSSLSLWIDKVSLNLQKIFLQTDNGAYKRNLPCWGHVVRVLCREHPNHADGAGRGGHGQRQPGIGAGHN